MIIGYCLYGQDNDSYMLPEHGGYDRCIKCSYLTDFNFHNPLYRIKKKMYDFSHPYDIGTIVSLKFKEFCLRQKYNNIIFKDFQVERDFFQFNPQNLLKFDPEGVGTKFSNYCDVCGNYEEVIGTTPPLLKDVSYELEEGFFRTDLLFGSKSSKNPIIIVGVETYRKLKKEKMTGIFYKAIEI